MTDRKFLASVFGAFLLIALGLFDSGCSSSSSPQQTGSNNVTPKTGSTYTYSKYQTDSNGTKIPGTDLVISASVIDDGKTVRGQNNVYTVVDDGDTAYFTYTSSNDVNVFVENNGLTGIEQAVGDEVLHRWIVLPITTHTSATVLDTNTTISVSGFQVPTHLVATVSYVGDETVKIGTTDSLVTSICKLTITATTNTILISPPATLTYERNISFSPKIGYIAKEVSKTAIPPIPAAGTAGSKSGDFRVLTSYTVK
ncbi:MAG: hypothetical protein Q8916_06940 [Bacteroidota bacterium]|nr:hypothetical protein [Bacteroidota bacterium]MDP4230126.1 hypothetical protein [Bacteroidota bacterium]MDP4236608.1 hypothetical protein [Bacteroidota bacterium]